MDKEATLEAVETSLDAAEEVVEAVEKQASALARLARSHKAHILAGVVLGAAAGSSVTYFIAHKKLRMRYEGIMEQEREDNKRYYAQKYKTDKYADPIELAKELGADEVELDPVQGGERPEDLKQYRDQVQDLKYHNPDKIETKPDEDESEQPEVRVETNVFVKPEDGWDYEEEVRQRTEDAPYILHHDEYMQAERDWQQSSLTYFAGDDVLIDEADKIIENTDDVVGDTNLTRFGHGSKDKNIVYIRNPRIEVEFEVALSDGKYSEEVLGFIQHSERPRHRGPRKFRSDDG